MFVALNRVVYLCLPLTLIGCSDPLLATGEVSGDSGKPVIEDYAPGSPDKPESESSTPIVNGQNSSPGEYPWAVYAGGCGGAYVGNGFVVTAAHCASEFRVGDVVNIGGHRVSQMTQGTEGEWRQITGRACHPNYRSWSQDFDICIVQLDQVPAAPALSIDRSNTQHAGTNAVVVGWGALREGGGSPDIQQEALLPVLEDSLCSQLYGSEYTGNMLCAGYLQGGIDSCQGDSGGPLVSTVTGELIGVVSWGRGCARQNSPGVYAQVNAFDDWLCETTGDGIEGCVQESPVGQQPPSEPTESACNVANPGYVGDGYCDGGAYNTEACGYDGGDCCPATCTPGEYACGSNGYDCQDGGAVGVCTAPRPEYIGDGYCDRDPAYNNEACAWDGGDCCDDTCQDAQYACGSNGFQCLDGNP